MLFCVYLEVDLTIAVPTVPILIILALATWRLSSLLSDEPGPWDLFETIRSKIGIVYLDDGSRDGKNELARNILCTWCNSLYFVGLSWALLYVLLGDLVVLLALPFALSTAAIYIERFIWRGSKKKY
jgi:hypothetical protein